MGSAEPDVIYVAVTTGTETVDGVKYAFNQGKTFVRSGHPLLVSCPGYFIRHGEFLDWTPEKRRWRS